ncbi:unnamed protein product [Rhizoctonia solani]|uniref:Secreted protein n=1 Tax=Rhizoctonia solani TaxID=456999 RepID=A0A8H2XYU4_9AGAM|nr:unnamed protein product [Rhizoctonia solani]
MRFASFVLAVFIAPHTALATCGGSLTIQDNQGRIKFILHKTRVIVGMARFVVEKRTECSLSRINVCNERVFDKRQRVNERTSRKDRHEWGGAHRPGI